MQTEKSAPKITKLNEENCPLCDCTLDFYFESNEIGDLIQEKVECPNCEVKVRDREYPLH